MLHRRFLQCLQSGAACLNSGPFQHISLSQMAHFPESYTPFLLDVLPCCPVHANWQATSCPRLQPPPHVNESWCMRTNAMIVDFLLHGHRVQPPKSQNLTKTSNWLERLFWCPKRPFLDASASHECSQSALC